MQAVVPCQCRAASNAGSLAVHGRLSNLSDDVKLTCYELFGGMLISLFPEVVFFTQQCRTDDFSKQHYQVVDGGDSEDRRQVEVILKTNSR